MPSMEHLTRIYGFWGSHPTYPVTDWQYDVVNGTTRRGYWDWVRAKLEEDR